MLKNYFVTALNSLLKNKLFSFINIAGLSVGLAACLLIVLYVQNETSYDRHWENGERIYRVVSTVDRTGSNPSTLPVNSMLLLPALKEYFADEIESGTQSIIFLSEQLYVGDRPFQQNVIRAEKSFLDIFELEVVAGSLDMALNNPDSIALSTQVAQRLFGREDVVGEVLSMAQDASRKDFEVAAVYRQPQHNTVLQLPALRLLEPNAMGSGWLGPMASSDYILLREGVDAKQLEARFAAFTDAYVDISGLQAGPDIRPSQRAGFQLQNIADVYLHSPFEANNGNRGNTTTVLAFSAIAVLVLLIGCINFTILGTARATQRAREVAMRKTVGADRMQLVCQFLGESFLVVLLATALGWALMELLLPVFETLVARDLDISYSSATTYFAVFSLIGATGLIGGLYPAFVLSHFQPAFVLKANRSAESSGSSRLRAALVVFQFSISIALMIATAIIYLQVQYSMQRDPGFNKDNLLVIQNLQIRPDVNANKNLLRERIARIPGITDVSLSGHQPMQKYGNSTYSAAFTLDGAGDGPRSMSLLMIDAGFFRTYQIPVVGGRDFEARDASSTFLRRDAQGDGAQSNAVINASAARMLGFTNPDDAVGKQISTRSFLGELHYFPIIGVVADTQFYSLRTEGRAEVYINENSNAAVLTARYQGDLRSIMPQIMQTWNSLMGDAELSLGDVGQNMAREFARENVEAQLLISFSLLAILISCLGLYGAAVFTVDRRTKEIGIRKVMGAQVREIVALLLWQFSRPVLLANVIAWPLALWTMLKWLQRFPYQIDSVMLVPLCILAGAIALSIAWLTVAGNTLRVATANPVHALRYE